MSRRRLLRLLGRSTARLALVAGGLTLFRNLRGATAAPSGTRGALGTLRPPGSVPEPEFLSLCIRCTRCADACQARCIRLFGPEAAYLQGTPYILPSSRGCTLCLACGAACPTGAILPTETRERVKIGVAVVDERLCVSHNGTGICGACHTICPLRDKAITQDFHNAPVVHSEACTGCGLCEEACIVRDRRAIRVKTTRVWQGA